MKVRCILRGAAVLGLFLGLTGPAQAGFSLEMTPARLELKADPGKTIRASVRLRTRGNATQKVEIAKGHFGLTDDLTPVFDDPKDAPYSAAAWLTLSQTGFSINPNQDKLLRLEFRVPAGTPPGDSRAAVFIAPPPPETKEKKPGAVMVLRGRLAFLVYLTVGGAKPNGVIKAWEWRPSQPGKPLAPSFQVVNQGTAHLRLLGIARVAGPDGKKYEAIVPAVPVLPGQTAWVHLEFTEAGPPPGSPASIEASIDLGQGEKKISANLPGRK